jgi:hypothetical protein
VTKPLTPNPQPTLGDGYDTYLIPRSKTSPAKNRLYDTLLTLGWRFDARTALWHTPADAAPKFGRLEYDEGLTWARIQGPNAEGSDVRGPTLLALRQIIGGRWVE